MGKPIIGVDVDLTIIDTGTLWNQWIADYLDTPSKEVLEGCSYDLRDLYKEELLGRPSYYHNGLLDFWRSETLYDKLKPSEESIGCLKEIHEGGFDVVFISSIKGNHNKSKYEFLKRHYPFMSGYLATKEKWYVGCDVMVDDRSDILNNMGDGCKCIRIKTPYVQYEEDVETTILLNDWLSIKEVL